MADINEISRLQQQLQYLENNGQPPVGQRNIDYFTGALETIPKAIGTYQEIIKNALENKKAQIEQSRVGGYFGVPTAKEEIAQASGTSAFNAERQRRIDEANNAVGLQINPQQAQEQIGQLPQPSQQPTKRAAFEQQYKMSPDTPVQVAPEIQKFQILGNVQQIYANPANLSDISATPDTTHTLKFDSKTAGGFISKMQALQAKSKETTLTPEALQQQAELYVKTGQIPQNLGFAGGIRIQIMNKGAEIRQAMGDTAGAMIIRNAAYKAGQAELNRLQSQRGTTMAFANTADSNLDLALKLSGQVDRTGSPILNSWILAGKRSVGGNPEVSAFDAALRTAINEYAKVTSSATGGGVTSDSARKEIEDMLNTAQTPEQIQSVIQTLKQEVGNRRAGYDDQINQVRSNLTNPVSVSPQANSQSSATPQTNIPKVQMTAPDGTPGMVPANKVGDLLKKGYKKS